MDSNIGATSVDMQNATAAALKFALDQAALANYGVRALREQAQQEGVVTIKNRGVVKGCSVSKSTTAARNLNITSGVCFANGRAYSVSDGNNAASVPSNIGTSSVVVYAYLFQYANNLWRLAVTPIGTSVPDGAITIYNLTIPANSTDATVGRSCTMTTSTSPCTSSRTSENRPSPNSARIAAAPLSSS